MKQGKQFMRAIMLVLALMVTSYIIYNVIRTGLQWRCHGPGSALCSLRWSFRRRLCGASGDSDSGRL